MLLQGNWHWIMYEYTFGPYYQNSNVKASIKNGSTTVYSYEWTTITVKGKEITFLLIESSILIDSSQIAKIFDKKEKTVATKVQKSKLEKYETENVKLLKNYGLMHPDAVKPRPFYDLRQMLEGPAYYYFKKEDETDLIDVIVRVAIRKHREWIHNKNLDNF